VEPVAVENLDHVFKPAGVRRIPALPGAKPQAIACLEATPAEEMLVQSPQESSALPVKSLDFLKPKQFFLHQEKDFCCIGGRTSVTSD
jgi:hypothetical protein